MCISTPLPTPSTAKRTADEFDSAKRTADEFDAAYALQACVLGVGASGTVLDAICRKSGSVVAVKRCDKEQLQAVELRNLQAEIRLHRTLKHPGIVDFHSAYESQTTISVVMERMQGGDLFERLHEQRRLSEAEAASVALQLLRALAYLHARRVVHRDIKPENMVYESRSGGAIKLIDFGIATQRQPGEKLTERCGSPQYVAPEVVLGNAYDESADVWSVGSVVYTLLTGEALCYDEDDIARQLRAGRLNFGHRFNRLSSSAQEFIRSLLDFSPEGRPTAREAMHHQWFHSVMPEEAAHALRLVAEDEQLPSIAPVSRLRTTRQLTLKMLGYSVLGLTWGLSLRAGLQGMGWLSY